MIEPLQSSRSIDIDDQLWLPGLFEVPEDLGSFDPPKFSAAFLAVDHGDTSSRRPSRSPSDASVVVAWSGTGLAATAPE
jgi:hypothetical protein